MGFGLILMTRLSAVRHTEDGAREVMTARVGPRIFQRHAG